jgi:predicted ATPase
VSAIVGRTEELGALFAFVEDGRVGPSALVLEGDPGIGKSTLLGAAVEYAQERGARVLLARPTEAERGLGHVALGDLLDGTLDDILPVLPPPRRHALEVTLLLEEPDDGAVDPRAVGLATRSALEALAERTPVLVAIDDLQWLDPSSERALAFAVRRLDATVSRSTGKARRCGPFPFRERHCPRASRSGTPPGRERRAPVS